MLVTAGNGILFLGSMTFFAIGFVGWFSFPKRDLSARLWMFAFMVSGCAPLPSAIYGEPANWAFVASSTLFATSFLLIGLALKALHNTEQAVADRLPLFAAALPVYALVLGYTVAVGSQAVQIMAFALGNGLAAIWATQQAIGLGQRQPTRFASHLAIILGAQATIFFLRIPQVLNGDESRLWQSGTINEITLVFLCLLGIVKAISYFALRFEEIRELLAVESRRIREQALELARKNSEIASAMHVVPIACVVTRPSLEVLYLNAQARRLLGGELDEKAKLSDWAVGLQGYREVTIAAARHLLIRNPVTGATVAVEVYAEGLEGESPAAQWVFSLKPVKCTAEVIESIWSSIPRVENRTWLVIDDHGITLSAQSAWGEVLGRCAIFQAPELGFDNPADPRGAKGMDLWASLSKFAVDISPLRHAQAAQQKGQATSMLLRDNTGTQLSCGLTPIHCEAAGNQLWLAELALKVPRFSSVEQKRRQTSQTTEQILAADKKTGDTHDEGIAGLRIDR